MHVMFRLLHLPGVLLLAATPHAGAQAPLPDPPAPAVIGRPLDQIRPVRVKPSVTKPARPTQGAMAAASAQAAAPPGVAPAREPPAPQPVAKRPPARSTHVVLGAHFSSSDQALVRRYYATQPAPARAAAWKVGEPVPPRAALSGVPEQLREALPALPPGLQYVQLDGDVVLVAVQARRVVDGVSRAGG